MMYRITLDEDDIRELVGIQYGVNAEFVKVTIHPEVDDGPGRQTAASVSLSIESSQPITGGGQ